jgi:transporter family protein
MIAPQALLIGGVVPAALLGLGTVLMKASVRGGIALPVYLAIVGATVLLYGLSASVLLGTRSFGTAASIAFAVAMGLSWSTAILCMSYGLTALRLPVSVVAPLTNANALVAVLLSAVFLAELKDLDPLRLGVGTLLIAVGATVVSTAQA